MDKVRVQLGDWCEGSWGTAFSVFSSVTGDCGVDIFLVGTIVPVSNTENLLVKWDIGFTIDQPENPLQPSLTPCLVWLLWPHPLHPLWT